MGSRASLNSSVDRLGGELDDGIGGGWGGCRGWGYLPIAVDTFSPVVPKGAL